MNFSFYDIFLVCALLALGLYVAIGYLKILTSSKEEPKTEVPTESTFETQEPVSLITDTTGVIEQVKEVKAKKPSVKKASKKTTKKSPRRRDL